MSLRRSRRLQVEGLECRITPAVSVRFFAGNLVIRSDNLSNDLSVLENVAGKFTVVNNTKTVGTFSNVNNLFILMGNGNDNVTLKIQTVLPGNLHVNLGNGYDKFSTIPSTPGARIGGNTLINSGLTSVRPTTVDPLDQYDEIVRLYNLRFGGNVTLIGSPGSGTGIADNENSKFMGTTTVINFSTVTLGDVDNAALGTTMNNLIVNNIRKNTDNRMQPAGPGNALYLFGGSAVNGNLTYYGGSGSDSVFLPSGPSNGAGVSIGGNVVASLGDGINTLQLGNVDFGATVSGNVYFTGGVDADRLIFDSGSVVAGNLYVSLGEGNNQLFGDSIGLGQSFAKFNPFGDATVFGDMTIILGNGDNFIGTYGLDPSSLTVAGNVTFIVGNGNNVGGDATGVPGAIEFFNTAVSVGGTATYQAGTGSNSFNITNETIQALRLLFSGGPTSLDFNQVSGLFLGNLFINFGTGFGPKSIGGTAGFGGNVTILNY